MFPSCCFEVGGQCVPRAFVPVTGSGPPVLDTPWAAGSRVQQTPPGVGLRVGRQPLGAKQKRAAGLQNEGLKGAGLVRTAGPGQACAPGVLCGCFAIDSRGEGPRGNVSGMTASSKTETWGASGDRGAMRAWPRLRRTSVKAQEASRDCPRDGPVPARPRSWWEDLQSPTAWTGEHRAQKRSAV